MRKKRATVIWERAISRHRLHKCEHYIIDPFTTVAILNSDRVGLSASDPGTRGLPLTACAGLAGPDP